MVDYKKLYAFLVGEIDDSLTIMDTGNLLQYNEVRDKLQAALIKAEDIVISQEEDGE